MIGVAVKAFLPPFLKPQVLLGIFIAAIIGYILWGGYHYIEGRGYERARQQFVPQIAELNTKLRRAESSLTAATTTANNQREAHENAVQYLRTQYEGMLADQKARLDTSEKRRKLAQEKLNEIERVRTYVSVKADNQCVVNAGFVRLYNESLQLPSSGTSEATGTPAVPSSGPTDADAPSGVALSTVGQVAAANNLECSRRGEVVQEWQRWYTDTYRIWTEAVKRQGAFTVVVPQSP